MACTGRRAFLAGLVALAAGLSSCAPAPAPPLPPPRRPPDPDACPLGVSRASVVTSRTPDGIALTFTVGPDGDAEDLRERVRGAARMHGPFGRQGKGHGGRHGMGGEHGLQAASLPRATARVVDVDGGARLELAAADPGEVDELRRRVRRRARAMRERACDH